MTLTPRELDILSKLLDGLSNKQIANQLGLAESTIKIHLRKIGKRMGVKTRIQIAVFAIRNLGM